jgi:cytochrome c553
MRRDVAIRTAAYLGAAAVLSATLSGAPALTADRPDWAFPPPQTEQAATARDAPSDNEPLHVPGSDRTYTRAQIDARMDAPDWFPNEHPPMPTIVAHGNGTTVRACIGCHLPHGLGHPENSRLAGSTAAYLARQLADFKSGVRGGEGVGNMTKFSQAMTDDDVRVATAYFAALKPTPWTRVVETDTVPKTVFEGTRRLKSEDGGAEPIGRRIIEVPDDQERVQRRDPHASFISYVPYGSVAKGEALAITGGDGRTMPCATCHGPGLQGMADVPNIAGRSPGQVAREIYYIQTGARGGPSAALMKPVVEKLSGDDVLALAAYVASLKP